MTTIAPTGGNGTRALKIAEELALAIAAALDSGNPRQTRTALIGAIAARHHAESLGITDEVKEAAWTHFGLDLANWGWH